MEMRTVRVQGWGTGTASITAELDGETVFSGDVELTELSDDTGSISTAPTLFSFEIPIEFDGTKKMRVKVGGAPVRFGPIVANYTEVDYDEVFYTGPYEFMDISPEIEGIRDPRRNVVIDGIAQTFLREGRMGAWHWNVYPGSTFEHDLLIKGGSDLEF